MGNELKSAVHLLTLVGGHVDILPFMLEHYRAQNIDSCVINLHITDCNDPVLDSARAAAARIDCSIGSVSIGDWQACELAAWVSSMSARPDDWWILADQDELHYYPDNLRSILAYCDRNGFDHIRGAFVDRLSADGKFAVVDPFRPLWPQFPLGGLVSAVVLGAYPMKVVAAKGRVMISTGHHRAIGGQACPIEHVFVQVHHFKWTHGIVERQRQRAATFRQKALQHWVQSARFVAYCDVNANRINIDDPRLLIAPCEPAYPHWEVVTAAIVARRAAKHRGGTR